MARSSQPLAYICRSCRHVLYTTRSTQQQLSIRPFSSSPQSAKTLATFTPTASPELDAALNAWRNQVFLPSILPPHHQALIYKTSRHEILTNPPGVTVTVQTALPPSAPRASEAGEESIKLSPMNSFDRPNKDKTLRTIKQSLSSTSDPATWDNLIPFLEGMRLARVKVYPSFLEQLTRKSNIQDKGRWNTILLAATLGKRTGVRLSQKQLTRELIIGAHHRGTVSSFKRPEPPKIVDRILRMLEAEEHCGGKIREDEISANASETLEYTDMRKDPVVVAATLSFAAAENLAMHTGKDEDGRVAQAVQKLLSLNDSLNGDVLKHLCGTSHVPSRSTGRQWDQSAHEIEALTVLRCGLGLASKVDMQKVLGKGKNVQVNLAVQKLSKDAKDQISRLRTEVEANAGGKERRCLHMADAVEKVLSEL